MSPPSNVDMGSPSLAAAGGHRLQAREVRRRGSLYQWLLQLLQTPDKAVFPEFVKLAEKLGAQGVEEQRAGWSGVE